MTAAPQTDFDLIITTAYPKRTAELRLLDGHGNQLAYRWTDFDQIPVQPRQRLFDLKNFLRDNVNPGQEAASVAAMGVDIAETVLGAEIFGRLWASQAQRTLRIKLPEAAEENNLLAAALARVPWEMARPAPDQPTLSDRNLVVRIVHDLAVPGSLPLPLESGESLRVLFVFTEARGSRPLAARRERQELLKLFKQEIYPNRRIEADFLTHGVTWEQLVEQITDRGGYHLVHWSGHGNLNLLELTIPGGARKLISGPKLLELFLLAGGYIPWLFFLSACHSGEIRRPSDWQDFLGLAQGKEPGAPPQPEEGSKDLPLATDPGFTGTAHALLQGGVPSVVAMRYAVGDDYARDLGVEFYRELLARTKPKNVATALTLARRALLDPDKPDLPRYAASDHVTPVLYGAAEPGFELPPGRSPALESRRIRLNDIVDLVAHEHFVGRTLELAGLGAEFIGSRSGLEVIPVALITGLLGIGKTALAAEALSLWESRFQWVLPYQAKPDQLGFEATLQDIHSKLDGELGRYAEYVKSHPADAIFRAATEDFTKEKRLERLTTNLIRALQDEAIMLVLDNFETNLKPEAEPGAEEPGWACQDPAWDTCLARLATELGGSPSRVLITCQRPLAALAGMPCHRVRLGLLPLLEAALYLREHPVLNRMLLGGDAAETALAQRLLQASRFHPLLMERLAQLAAGGLTMRPQLLEALQTLEQSQDYSQLPDLFAAGPGDTKEMAYLEGVLTSPSEQFTGIDRKEMTPPPVETQGPVSGEFAGGDNKLVLLVEQRQEGGQMYLEYTIQESEALALPTRRLRSKPWADRGKGPAQTIQAFVEQIYECVTQELRSHEDLKMLQREARAQGAMLCQELLEPEVARVLWPLRSRIKVVEIVSWEQYIPWELVRLRDPASGDLDDRFLAEYGLVRRLPGHLPPQSLPMTKWLYLVASFPRGTLPSFGDEYFTSASPDSLQGHGITPEALPAQRDAFYDALAAGDFDVLHLDCYAEAQSIGKEKLIIGEDDGSNIPRLIEVDSLTAAAEARLEPRRPLVFLASLTGWSDWPHVFLRAGAGAFVGTSWGVREKPAAAFTTAFYNALLAGKTLVQAVDTARAAAKVWGDLSWLAFKVYGHPDARRT